LQLVSELCDSVLVLAHGKVIFNGKSNEGVSLLRSWFSKGQMPTQNETSSKKLPKQCKANIKSLRLLINDSETIYSAKYSDRMSLEIEYSITEAMNYIQVNLEFKNRQGVNVFSTSSEDFDFNILSTKGTHKVIFSWPSLPLGDGTYLISVSFADKAYQLITQAPDALSFVINNESINTGIAFLPTELKQIA